MSLLSEVTVKLVYTKDLDLHTREKPYVILTHIRDGMKKTNLEWEDGPEEVLRNIRGSEGSFSLDNHGFCFRSCVSTFQDWENPAAIEGIYLPELEKWVRSSIEGVDDIELFDWRRRAPVESLDSMQPEGMHITNLNNPMEPLMPAAQVHLDQSPTGVLKRVRLLMGARAPFLLRGRIRVINVWRPLAIVEDDPLALCDGQSMHYSDLLEVDLVRRNYVGSTMYAKYRPGYKWYFLDLQTPDEVCIFKNFDSDEDVKAQMCPHVSFSLKNHRPTAPSRKSIEARFLVFTYPEDE